MSDIIAIMAIIISAASLIRAPAARMTERRPRPRPADPRRWRTLAYTGAEPDMALLRARLRAARPRGLGGATLRPVAHGIVARIPADADPAPLDAAMAGIGFERADRTHPGRMAWEETATAVGREDPQCHAPHHTADRRGPATS
ncbi:hypothetical protein [Bifidobacterium myosotis]|uniref:Uncharacterized protein n=1 Tax=Bifidobacterium myosotis TaxID=1630166 RepID=A0A5M9ZHJ1_9BIFI|nr:hypothetical protein [Bifidobacterium myosotis]KAA8826978.1 hypothetical protein EMO91_10630 [Bifidobacterium myosotis]